MQAIHYDRYGTFDVLALGEVARPAPKPTEALIEVRAAALHVGDCFAVRGAPLVMRTATGLLRPRPGIPGFDAAGRVAAVGSAVARIRPGDEVFGAGTGTCAEFAVMDEGALAPKPAALSFEQAAAMPTSGLAALHALRDVGRVRAGQRVLINGASGGIGTFAVQIGKALGAEVTGVCSGASAALVRGLGADHVVDYTREDFTAGVRRYDVILDNVENRGLAEMRRALAPAGTLILNSGTGARGLRLLVRMVKPLALSPFVRHRLRRFLSVPTRADLEALAAWVESGKLAPVVDRVYPLADTAAALAYIERGHARGKVVVAVSGS